MGPVPIDPTRIAQIALHNGLCASASAPAKTNGSPCPLRLVIAARDRWAWGNPSRRLLACRAAPQTVSIDTTFSRNASNRGRLGEDFADRNSSGVPGECLPNKWRTSGQMFDRQRTSCPHGGRRFPSRLPGRGRLGKRDEPIPGPIRSAEPVEETLGRLLSERRQEELGIC